MMSSYVKFKALEDQEREMKAISNLSKRDTYAWVSLYLRKSLSFETSEEARFSWNPTSAFNEVTEEKALNMPWRPMAFMRIMYSLKLHCFFRRNTEKHLMLFWWLGCKGTHTWVHLKSCRQEN